MIDPLLRESRLPHLASLCSRGLSAVALSDRAPGDDHFRPQTAWATAATGRTAAHHGITRFFHERRDLRVPTLWDYWLEAGLSVGIYGWPGTWPPEPCSGFVVPSHLARDERAWPPELSRLRMLEDAQREAERQGSSVARAIRSAPALVDLYRLGVRGRTLLGMPRLALRVAAGDEEEAALALRRARLSLAADVFVELCRRFDPRLRAFVTFLADFASHRYWRYYEPGLFEPEAGAPRARLRSAVPDAYVQVDRALGRLLTTADEETTVLVLSEHGMAPEPRSAEAGRWRLVLRPAGLTALVGADASIVGCPIARWMAFRRRGGGDTHALSRLAVALTSLRLESGSRLLEVWDRGDEVIARIAAAAALEAQADPVRALVEYDGRRVPIDRLARRLGRTRSAMHDGEGIAILAGPGVSPGRTRETIRLVDVAPTLLTLAGLPVPAALEGRSVVEPGGDYVV